MVKAKLPLKHRDYCAHYYISYLKCKRDAGRFMSLGACGHEKHEWEHCQYEDFVMRMKEHEKHEWEHCQYESFVMRMKEHEKHEWEHCQYQ